MDSGTKSLHLETLEGTDDRAELLRRAARAMIRARVFETKITSLYRAGKIIGGVYTGKGQEAFSAALAVCLHRGDIYSPLIRDAAGRAAFGEPLVDGFRTYWGSVLGPMHGRDGNVHRGRPKEGLVAMISHLGTSMSVVNGMLLARRLKGEGGIGASTAGDGMTSTGAFHEALNQAAVLKLPIVVSIANNQYAYSTPNENQFACADLLDRAIGYGVTGHRVDAGNSISASLDVMMAATAAVRAGEGPQLVVGQMLRLSGHGEHDDARYVSEAHRNSPLGRDCMDLARKELAAAGILDQAAWEDMEQQAIDEVQRIQGQVSREAGPNPYTDDWRSVVGSNPAR